MTRCKLRAIGQLESRLCLTVAVEVDDGDLIVDGQADVAVEIVAVDQGTFQVSNNGGVVDTTEGVTDDIRIEPDAEDGAADDDVTLDLAGQAVDRVVVDLGDGDNSFLLQGGTVGRFSPAPARGGVAQDARTVKQLCVAISGRSCLLAAYLPRGVN